MFPLVWLGFVPVLLCAALEAEPNADRYPLRMDSVTGILEELESHLEGAPDRPVLELSRELGCLSEFCQFSPVLETSVSLNLPYLSEKQRSFLRRFQNHRTDGTWVEHGAVLTPDGTTVALSPLLDGVVGGLLERGREGAVPASPGPQDPSNSTGQEPCPPLDPLLAPLAKSLAVATSLFHAGQSEALLGPNGCWDDIRAPQTFTLLGSPSPMPDAFINGAMDGVILGTYLAENASSPFRISRLLREYYAGGGLAGESHTRSNFRRKTFAGLVTQEKLRAQVESALCLLQHLHGSHPLLGNKTAPPLAIQAVEEFTAFYVECPAIIPRCMWGAQPYKGTPTPLQLPLGFVYIHHTHSPGKPCQTFPECAADMRSMQRFHQVVRGWDDIGYSFVVGGDGYIYQGRGWQWVGAHTLGHNSKGFGVSFIGDYMKALPDPFALELVKDNFMRCAVRGSRLKANYTVYGHRQVVLPTLCPGDRLFQEIKTWRGFRERCFMNQGIPHCI
ncbi:N-acetylmuramoyl-L-alanine amidase [Heteronotia binoei]|uniref:N-acetylmuramoyl-L-alanine amidase n=1 Tax=Heteronotia binoei TaxID=13085 RepID=UPI00292E37A5|nr:N-acetylmuramoyl-L-alanine amidase [Heteronotia binoei]